MAAKTPRKLPEVTLLERLGLFFGGGALLMMGSAEVAFVGWLFLRVSGGALRPGTARRHPLPRAPADAPDRPPPRPRRRSRRSAGSRPSPPAHAAPGGR